MAIEYTPLTEERVAFLAQRYVDNIKDKLGHGLQTRSNPTTVLVGGQTGAGKSGLAREAATELSIQGAAVPIDADVMRELLVRKGEKPTPEQTQPDALRLTNLVRDIAMKERYNVIEQGTFARPEFLKGWVDSLHQEGYRVEMHAMATPRMVSKISTYTRLEQEYKDGEPNPRWVRPEVHDATYYGFGETIKNVDFDRVKISHRDLGTLYDSDNIQGSLIADKQEAMDIGRMLLVEQQARSIGKMDGVILDATERGVGKGDFYMQSAYAVREEVKEAHAYTPQEREARIGEVREASVGYTATPSQDDDMDVQAEIQKAYSEMMGNATEKYIRNVAELAADERYNNHSATELATAAYWRGIQERSAATIGQDFDKLKFDTALSNRENVGKLPEPPDVDMGKMEKVAHDVAKDVRGTSHDDELSL